MKFQGYGLRFGQISYVATDEKSWYGVHFYGFSPDSSLPQVEFQPNFGFAARPVDATNGTGCNGFYSLDGEFAWLGHDARFTDKCPPLTPGSAAMWNSDGSYQVLDAEAQTSTQYVKVGDSAHMITVGKTGSGKTVIDILSASGARFTLGDEDTLWRCQGNAFIRMKGDNITANGTFKGGSADFGGGAGLPVVNATALATAVTATIAAFSGGGAPATQAQVAAMLTAIAAALTGPAATTMLKAL
jgi:hypothetical protein